MDIRINPESARWIELVTRPIPIKSPQEGISLELLDSRYEALHLAVKQALLSYDSRNWIHRVFSYISVHLTDNEYKQLILLENNYGGLGKVFVINDKNFIRGPEINREPTELHPIPEDKDFVYRPGINDEKLWICFPFSKLKTSKDDPGQQDSILNIHGETYGLGSRIVKLLRIPAVDSLANIQYIEITDIELDLTLDKLYKNLNLSKSEELLSDARYPIFVAHGAHHCSICYAASSIGEDRNNILHLQSDVERCVQANLAQLDDCEQKLNWRDGFIKPLLNNASIKANISLHSI